jgi:hypothetical protein
MNDSKAEQLENFEAWLITMDEYLNELISTFPETEQPLFDYSSSSLDFLEKWLLNTFPSPKALRDESQRDRLNCISCYVGEVFRKAVGGGWSINLDEPDYIYYGLPIVATKGGHAPICPMSLAITAVARREGNYLSEGLRIFSSASTKM